MEARFHPETAAAKKFGETHGIKAAHEYASVHEARSEIWRLSRELYKCPDLVYEGTKTEIIVPSPHNTDGIPVFVYKPSAAPPDAAILVYFHGGGFVLGSRLHVEDTCKAISKLSNCIVVNVEYRLAPEHPYPTAVQDAVSTTQWVIQNPDKIGGNASSKVGVGGDSAGGVLASISACEVKGIAFQVLIYPWYIRSNLPSHTEFKDGPGLSQDLIEWFIHHTFPNAEELNNTYFQVMKRDKFVHLPPALFVVAELDILRDESYEYEQKLKQAGVETDLQYVEGVLHGYFTKPGCYKETAFSSYRRVADFITKLSHTT